MASNPTPRRYEELVAATEDLADGVHQHEVTVGIVHNTEAMIRSDLQGMLNAATASAGAHGQPLTNVYGLLRTADSNAKGFLARAIKVLAIGFGDQWSQPWEATGLPDQTVGVPNTQDGRFGALGSMRDFFGGHSGLESAQYNVTGAEATALYTALSDARSNVNVTLGMAAAAQALLDTLRPVVERRFRGTVNEIGELIGDEDPRWYDFGLNRPGDPSTPGQVGTVQLNAAGPGAKLVSWDGARRADSFNVYKQIIGTDAEPVKVHNTTATQYVLAGLPVGTTVSVTITGVNAAGEGIPSTAVQAVVA